MQIPLLSDIVIIFGLAVPVLYLCHQLRVPAIVGFLLTGVLAGPYGLGLIGAVHEVEIPAEIGVVLLLFTIGLEFSMRYGLNGRNVARAAWSAGIPYMIVEINPVMVKKEKSKGEPIYYGDASREAVLDHVDVHNARIMVVAIPDPVATRMVVASARSLNPRLHIIARTRYLPELTPYSLPGIFPYWSEHRARLHRYNTCLTPAARGHEQ